ncbi:hypothetical protein [Nocardia carnea]|uniref:hypothetical protein n=1 Tax=Nocardia carnea TaxID=37328 RepID=UPI002458F3B0|nr:hypothetical protein [Nocardia carnea]
MTLRIIAQNRLHRPITDAIQDSNGFIENLCVQASPKSPLWGVDPAADTMFNEYQLNAIIDELGAWQSVENSGSQHIQELRTVAMIAARKGGYLWFYGSTDNAAE